MAKVLSEEQAEEINRACRETEALAELDEIGARIALQEPGCFVVVLHSIEGKRKQFSSISAQGALADVQSFLAHHERLKPDAPSRFIVSKEERPEVEIIQRQGSENAHKKARRRTLEFDPQGNLIAANDAAR